MSTKRETRQAFARRKLAYQRTFCGDRDVPHLDAEIVLEDLKKFCGMKRPGIAIARGTGAVDPYASIYQAALRDVYIHITGLLGIDITNLFKEASRDHTVAITEDGIEVLTVP